MLFKVTFLDERKVSLSPMALFYYEESFQNRDFLQDLNKIVNNGFNSMDVLRMVYASEKAYLSGQILDFENWIKTINKIDFANENLSDFITATQNAFFPSSEKNSREAEEQES